MTQHAMAQNVNEVMTPVPVTVSPDTPLARVGELMRQHGIGDVLVVHEGRLRGLVTDRDIVVRGVALGRDMASTAVADICSTNVITVPVGEDAATAVRLMSEHAVRRLPSWTATGPSAWCRSAISRSSATSVPPSPTSVPNRRTREHRPARPRRRPPRRGPRHPGRTDRHRGPRGHRRRPPRRDGRPRPHAAGLGTLVLDLRAGDARAAADARDGIEAPTLLLLGAIDRLTEGLEAAPH
ncbi:CBS domain-containing protein, partial [Actinomadura sp. CNU-125]|uniref:CBS domain-containing protein n=1 Tax=Actinomadura sp. CNU-125 TaxID=1904961 RepID=UPI0021CC568E